MVENEWNIMYLKLNSFLKNFLKIWFLLNEILLNFIKSGNK